MYVRNYLLCIFPDINSPVMLQHNIDHLEVLFPAVLMFPQKTHPKTKQKKPTKNIAPEY